MNSIAQRILGRLLQTAWLLLILVPLMAWRHAEDLRTANLAPHSTFHYELTRTLARAAGFDSEQAELIAVVDQAMDAQDFTGETGVRVILRNIQRVSPAGLFWHFARRDSRNVTGEYAHPGQRNSCEYFTGTMQACPQEEPELSEIEAWAVYGEAITTVAPPEISRDGGSSFEDVSGETLEALGAYLHALADSYSHEACMAAASFRGHKPRPVECSGVRWHEQAEYGEDEQRDFGVPYTEEAALATWQALKWFRSQNGMNEPPLWSDQEAESFISEWVQLNRAQDRRNKAVSVMAAR